MPLPTSGSSAPAAERPVLAPAWSIVLLTVLVCGALWLLYPRKALEQRLSESGDSELANNYLQNLLHGAPDDPYLRLLLARRQIATGETARARVTLQPALNSPDPDLRKQAEWTEGILLYRELQDAEGNADQSQVLQERMQRHIRALARESWPPAQLASLAAMAEHFGMSDVATDLLRKAAPKDPEKAAAYYAQAAKEALGRGDYGASAQFYLAARASTPDPAEAKRYYFAAVAALRSGNETREALALAERELGPLENDAQALYMLVQLARAAGRPDVADRYVRRLLHMSRDDHASGGVQLARAGALPPPDLQAVRDLDVATNRYDDGASLLGRSNALRRTVADSAPMADAPMMPFDDKTYTLAYQVFLEGKQLEDAWKVANAAVRQQPDNMAWRARLAQVSEWTQRPALALQNWLDVALATHDEAAWKNVLHLAPFEFKDPAVAQALDAAQRSGSSDPWLHLVLARRQIAQGNVSDARATLQPALDSTHATLRQEALLTQAQLSYRAYELARKDKSDRRDVLLKTAQDEVQRLAQQTWSSDQREQLAILASKLGEADLSMRLYGQDVPQDPAAAATYYEHAAQEALGQGDYDGCARLYLAARASTTDPTEAKRYYFAAVAALRSGNKTQQALDLAQREIGPLADDRQTLLMLTELARAAGRPDVADRFVRRLLHVGMAGHPDEQRLPAHTAALQPAVWHVVARPAAEDTGYDDGASLLTRPGAGDLREVVDRTPPSNPAALPFDDKTYTLAYQVFLENKQLQDAWAIANTAVRQRPADMAWRKRLAQVSEWTQRPAVALQNWLLIARSTHDEDAWQNVLRLAPGLFDNAAVTEALRHELTRQPDDPKLIREFVAAQERMGEPQPAIDYLRRRAHSPDMLALLAELAERAGQSKLALETWSRLFADPAQVTPQRATRAALLALAQGQSELGLKWLEAAQGEAAGAPVAAPVEAGQPTVSDGGRLTSQRSTDVGNRRSAAAAGNDELLRLTGQVAANRSDNRLAIAAYRKLVAAHGAAPDDYDALYTLLRRQQPVEAAHVALLAWQRFGDPRHFFDALSLLSERNDWTEFASAVKQMDHATGAAKESVAGIRRSVNFLRLMGEYESQAGDALMARVYYEQAFKQDPASTDTRQSLLWFLIDSGDTAALRGLLALHEQQWSRDSDLHDALAAAYQRLSLYHVALERYLTPHLEAHRNDFLWLMNYADALEQDNQVGRAWTLRHRLLAQQWKRLHQDGAGSAQTPQQAVRQWLSGPNLDAARRVARARLVMTQRPGDPAYDVLRELLRLDRNAQGKLSNAAADVAVGWLQETGNYSAERGFLWQQYALSRSQPDKRPLWAQTNLALSERDTAAAGQLLEQSGARMSAADRVAAATAVGDVRLAQSTAFDNQIDQPDDDDMHQQLTESLLGFSNRIDVTAVHRNLDGVNENQTGARLHLPLNPRWALDFHLDRINRSVTKPDLLRSAPSEDIAKATLDWRHPKGDTRLQVANRRGYVTTTPVLLQHEQRITPEFSVRGELGWNLPTDESLPLRLAGMKTRLAARLGYQFTPRDQVALTQAYERYRLQTGVEVGSGRHTTVEYTHTVWQGAPSLEAGVFWSTHHYNRRDPTLFGAEGARFQDRFVPLGASLDADYLLPATFRFYGIRLSTNMQYEQERTRPIRPFASISRTWHSQLGPGYDLTLGVAGSVFGGDRLSLGWNISKSGVQSLGFERTLQLSYQLNF